MASVRRLKALALLSTLPFTPVWAVARSVKAIAVQAGAAQSDFAPIPESSDLDATTPTAWSGQLTDKHDRPISGAVTLAIRPSAAQIHNASTSGQPMPAMIPLAKQRVGTDGHFVLKGRPPIDLSSAYRADGWINMLLVASDGNEIRLVTDSMYYDDKPLTERSHWLTSPSARETREGISRIGSADSAVVQRLENDLSSSTDRPASVQFDDSRIESGSASYVGPGWPYFACTVNYVANSTIGYQNIADANLQPNWKLRIDYRDTTSSSFEVGYSADGQAWQIAGSASFSHYDANGFNTDWPVQAVDGYNTSSFQIRMNYDEVQWRCSNQNNPNTYYPYTTEPTSWLGGVRNDLQPVISCPNSAWYAPVAGGTVAWKGGGSGATWSASGGAFGFNGKATVGYDNFVQLGWYNGVDNTRNICGESGDPLFTYMRVATKK